MLKKFFIVSLSLLVLCGNGFGQLVADLKQKESAGDTGTLEKMIVANASVSFDLDLNRLNGLRSNGKELKTSALRFDAERNSFFTTVVFNDELRAILPSSMPIIPQGSANVPAKLSASYGQLVIENMPLGGPYELTVRDGKSGFTFFNIEGQLMDFNGETDLLTINEGRLLLTKEFATELGRPNEAGTVIGQISIRAAMRPIEITKLIDGESKGESIPAVGSEQAGTVPGPDVVVGDLNGLAQFGVTGTMIGLAVGTDSCNFGTVDLNWLANPNNDHPVIPQNMYRMSGGANNSERFEQIGQSSVKHGFTALTQNLCALGCNGVGGSRLGSGCSDPYSAGLNAGPNLGSRAWINPFTGFFPRNDSATPNNNHAGHTHTGAGHRILTESSNLNPGQNPGATYYAEAQYVTPHEYAHCQANPTQCNMYNNVSYRQYNVSGSGTSFSFTPAAATVRAKTAVSAWTGASLTEIRPAPNVDGIGTVAYKVTQTSANVWHYEYAVYNMNLDRAIQSFGVPVGSGATLSNIGFNAPPQQPASTGDGTVGDAGFSNAAWAQTQTATSMTWNSETFAQNPNANAIRWGTMYNFRFDSNRPPETVNATVGFFKTGSPITVAVQAPSAAPATNFTVSGRVYTERGQGIARALVSITDSNGVTRSVTTGALGTYTFDNVAGGGTYTISVQQRRYSFTPRTITVNSNATDIDFLAGPV